MRKCFTRFFKSNTYLLLIAPLFLTTYYKANAQRVSALQQWDDRVLINLAEHRTPQKTGLLMAISNSYIYGEIGLPAGMLIGGIVGKDQQLRQNALYVASSTLTSGCLTALIKTIVKRPRPFVKNLRIVSVYKASYYSFPSGHTSSTIATATAVSMAYPKWYVIAPAFLWAGSVGYSRMYLGVHYPTDVGAGALLGAGSAVSMSFLRK